MKLVAKISVSMILLALLATLLAALLAGFTIRRSFDEYVDRNLYYRLDGIRMVLADYYLDKGSWTDVQTVFDSLQLKGHGYGYYGGQAGPMAGRRSNETAMMGLESGDVLLLDANGNIVASSDMELLGKPVSEASIGQSLSITVNDATVGSLIVLNLQKGVLENEFISSLNKAILWAAVFAAIVALILGTLISKHLTKPLAMLTNAASRLAGRDLGYRCQ